MLWVYPIENYQRTTDTEGVKSKVGPNAGMYWDQICERGINAANVMAQSIQGTEKSSRKDW